MILVLKSVNKGIRKGEQWMKALTLWQPWATLVAIGAKRIETRSWSTNYRGPLAIHAAKRVNKKDLRLCFRDPFFESLTQAGYRLIAYHLFKGNTLSHGAIVATCDLVDIQQIDRDFVLPTEPELSFGDFTLGRYAWFLDNIEELKEPIPCKGAQRLWELGSQKRAY